MVGHKNNVPRRVFLYEFRLDTPDMYLDSIDLSGCEFLQMLEEGRKVFYRASLHEPSLNGPYTVGDKIQVPLIFVSGKDLPRLLDYYIAELFPYQEPEFMKNVWEDSPEPTFDEMNAIFKTMLEWGIYLLQHPETPRPNPIPDYIGYLKPSGKLNLLKEIPDKDITDLLE